MAKTVLEGLKASTSNFMTFRVSAKLTEDITMLVNVPRFLKIKFEGLRVKINGKNLACEEQGPKLQHLAKVWKPNEQNRWQKPRMQRAGTKLQTIKKFGESADPRRPAWAPVRGPRPSAQRQKSRTGLIWVRFWVHSSCFHLP